LPIGFGVVRVSIFLPRNDFVGQGLFVREWRSRHWDESTPSSDSAMSSQPGEALLPLARELGVSRKLLHDWRKAWGPAWARGIEPQARPQTRPGG
jgi:hypothetical protein